MAERVTVWHELPVGTVVESPFLTVTDELIGDLVRLGGYTHPLFTDPEYVHRQSPLAARPLPGAAVLHLMGGLAEQCGVLDGSVLALRGFAGIRFRSPAVAGDQLRLRLTIGSTTATGRASREELQLSWTMVRKDGSVVAEADARMLVARP